MLSHHPVVTHLSIDGRGEWIPNCEDSMLVPRLGMVLDRVENCPEFYKKYIIYVDFSIRNDPTGKHKLGKYWKRYMCYKEGFRQPATMPEIATVIAEAMQWSQRRR